MQLMHLTICLELGQAGDPQRQDHPPANEQASDQSLECGRDPLHLGRRGQFSGDL